MKSENRESTGIIVLGMHRSGTSLLAKILEMSGAWLGEKEDVSAAGPDNPTGFWEHGAVRSINQCLFEASGASWDSVLRFDLKKVPKSIDHHLREKAKEIVAHFQARKIWAIKDPRLCLTLPWWRPLIGNAVVIHVNRSPLDIAHSLETRDHMSSDMGIALWEYYSLCAVDNSEGMPRVVANYNQMVDDPVKAQADLVNSILETAKVNLSIAPSKELSQFTSRKLRHYYSDRQSTHKELTESQWKLYKELQATNASIPGINKLSQKSKQVLETNEISWDKLPCKEVRQFSEMQRELMAKLFTLVAQVKASKQDYSKELFDIHSAVAVLRNNQDQTAKEVHRLCKEFLGLRKDLKAANEQLKMHQELKSILDNSMDRLHESELVIDNLSHENKALSRWLSDVLDLAEMTMNSARWRVGNSLVRGAELALFRKKPRLAVDVIDELRQQFKSFESSTTSQFSSQRFFPKTGADETDCGLEPDSKVSESSRDFIIFPIIDWNFRIQRPQHLARELAQGGNRVFYLSLEPALGATEAGYEIIEKPIHLVHVVKLLLPAEKFPNVYSDVLDKDQTGQLLDALYALIQQSKLTNMVALVDLPFWSPVASALPGTPLIYDCMDYHGGFSTATKKTSQLEAQLVEQCDLLVVTSRWLWDRHKDIPGKCLIPNAGEVRFFSKKPDNTIDFGDGPIVGYVGAIADWFDVDLVVKVATSRPDVEFILVGSTAFCDTAPLKKLENVRLVGEVPYLEVPRYVHAFDCCFIPFQLTELIRATSPVKIYEYLAAGKPVVSINLPELEPISDLVHLAKTADEFTSLIDVALDECADKALAEQRATWASRHDWSHRINTLLAEIENIYPKVSVIVLCYNNLEFTKSCLKSLLGVGWYPDVEIIVVDNGSTDGTYEYLQELKSRKAKFKVITNNENLGFSAGNNVGIKAAEGDYVVMLNNDTYVTPGWIFGLIRHLRRDPGLGLVGPVTNNIGNEAKIDIHYKDMESMIKASFKYSRDHKNDLHYVPTVAFFCVAFSRELLEKVGMLDEQFGQGFFEDDDYCRRVSDAGYKIAIAEDVFVHHHLSATFSKENKEERDKLFANNKKKFELKWGKWKPHEYRQ